MGILRRTVVPTLAAVVLAATAGSAAAQGPGSSPPKFFGVFVTSVGVWAEYDVNETDTGRRSTMRNAIVGQEDDGWWYEVVMTDAGARNVIKMFVKGDPNNPENIQRLIMKNGDQPAQEMPREFVVMGRRMATHMFEARSGGEVAEVPTVKIEEIGKEKVTVPAGTFDVMRNRVVDAEGRQLATYDYTEQVPPFGVVRSETPKVKLELVAHGTDAKSVITETPVMMKTPPGMPEGNPRGRPPGMEAPPPRGPASGGYGAPSQAPASGGYGR